MYFQAALNNGFSETTTQRIVLDDDDPDIFRTHAAWLFEHKIDCDSSTYEEEEAHLYELYIFADKRGIHGLADDTVTILAWTWTSDLLSLAVAQRYLPLLRSKSPLYNLVLDNIILKIRHLKGIKFWEVSEFGEFSEEVLLDLLKRENAYSGDFMGHDACMQSICRYHVHRKCYSSEYPVCFSAFHMSLLNERDREHLRQVEWRWYDFHD